MKASLKNYLTGYIISIALTLLAYFAVSDHLLKGSTLIAAIFILAFVQLIAQLLYFLHLGTSSRWNLIFLISTVAIIFLVVGGSLWIMYHLNYNMTPSQINDYLKDQGSF